MTRLTPSVQQVAKASSAALVTPRRAEPAAGRRTTIAVVAIGCAVEATLVFGLVWPLWIGRSPRAIDDAEPLASMVGQTWGGLARFVAALVVWVAGYALVLALGRRELSGVARRALAAFPVVFALTLALTWPAASKDLYHYVMEGRALVVHGANPMVTPPAALPDDPLGWIMSSWEWEPSRYGPLWALVAAVPALIAGEHLRAVVLLFKAIDLVALFGTAWLVYLTARRLWPEQAQGAWVFVAWNPLLLFESAANGHNDTLMLAFTALALYLASRRDWRAAFPALAAAALIKYVTGLLGPLLLVHAWREGAARPRVMVGLVLGALLTAGAYALFWEGSGTFAAVGGATGEALNSPGWLLREALERAGVPAGGVRWLVSVPLVAAFGAVCAAALRRVWRGDGEIAIVIQAGLWVIGGYICTMAWWFWPWYVTWLVPLAALAVSRRSMILVTIWSAAALAAYVPINYRLLFWGETPTDHMPLFAMLTAFVPPALAALVLYGGLWRRPGRSAVIGDVTVES